MSIKSFFTTAVELVEGIGIFVKQRTGAKFVPRRKHN